MFIFVAHYFCSWFLSKLEENETERVRVILACELLGINLCHKNGTNFYIERTVRDDAKIYV